MMCGASGMRYILARVMLHVPLARPGRRDIAETSAPRTTLAINTTTHMGYSHDTDTGRNPTIPDALRPVYLKTRIGSAAWTMHPTPCPRTTKSPNRP
jgi:hypothetical protein